MGPRAILLVERHAGDVADDAPRRPLDGTAAAGDELGSHGVVGF
jgi:hypothetical protein